MLLLVCVMGTDTDTVKAFAISAGVFLLGICVFAAILFLAIVPERLEKHIPGPSIIGKILARIPTYPCGTAGLLLLLRQTLLVTIPDLLLWW